MRRLIKSIVKESNLDELFIQSTLNRLYSFGYEVKEEDALAISFAIEKVERHIKNVCNIVIVPKELFSIAIDMICAEFLLMLKQLGKLELSDIDLSTAITQIKEGDTAVSFGSGTSDEEKLMYFINYLKDANSGELVCYRKVRW